ncbi:MAG TPA: hypothetical protein VN255_08985 [Mycobacterium sp.]|nr:hypothetical protein [Mycobacterium sp.]HWT48691.1 hypothetical protein [Mycobacterium sp.]
MAYTEFGIVHDYREDERIVVRGGMGGTVVTSFEGIGQHLIARDDGATLRQDRCDLARA